MSLKNEAENAAAMLRRFRDGGSFNQICGVPITDIADMIFRLEAATGTKDGLDVEEKEAPIPMILVCPECRMTHVDRPEPEKGWLNPPHRTHLCHHCGNLWRPANIATTGVSVLPKS